jgi:hypothetical protein
MSMSWRFSAFLLLGWLLLAGRINWLRFLKAVEEQTGAPVDISR